MCCVAVLVAACGGDATTPPPLDPPVVVPPQDSGRVAKVTLTIVRPVVALGTTVQLKADVIDAAGAILAGRTISWSSSRTDVATITSLGVLTAVGAGTTSITAMTAGLTATATLVVVAPPTVVLTSDVGDPVGQGRSYVYTTSNAVIRQSTTTTTVQLAISGEQLWNATFQLPTGALLAPGSYPIATRWPFQGNGAGLRWDGEGRGCAALTGSFTIDTVNTIAGGGSFRTLLGLDLRFEQRCEGSTGALRGTIHWRFEDPPPSGPATPIPSNLWQPPASAIPASGDFVYLESDRGDVIGQGATNLYRTGIVVSSTIPRAMISVAGYTGTFQVMNALAILKVGYYSNLLRFPLASDVIGGLDWSGNGRACNQVTGWFVIDRVNYVNGVLVGIELRFEQHCEGVVPALHGAIRWGQLSS